MRALRIRQAADFGKVAVAMGGTAAEREISLKSGRAVFAALQRLGVDAEMVDIGENPIAALTGRRIDRVFNIVHGRGGEDGVLQALLQVLRIPYTGSGVLASALAMDKLRTKLCWQGMGLRTPKWMLLEGDQDIGRCVEQLGFPLIVKPAQEGSSLGMSKASNESELHEAFQIASAYRCEVYAEQWIKGQEYTIAVLDDEALPVIRLQTPNQFYDFEAKYRSNTTRYHCPSGLGSLEEQALQELAVRACNGLAITGWARVDAFIDEAGQMQLIEVNTVPGMTDHSLVPMAAQAAGIDFDELVWRILESSYDG